MRNDTAGKVKCELGGCGDALRNGDCQKHGSMCKEVYIRHKQASTGLSADPPWPSSRADTALPCGTWWGCGPSVSPHAALINANRVRAPL